MNSFRIKKIESLDLGIKLSEARKIKKFDLNYVYGATNIPLKYLQAIEAEEWDKLPGEIYIKNFLKTYCEFLGLNYKLCLKQYQKQSPELVLKNKKKKNIYSFITPKRFKIFIFVLIFSVFITYIYYRVSDYTRPPKLNIIAPIENFTTLKNIIKITGQTEPESIVSINNEDVSVNEEGSFYLDVKLKYGLNKFEIISQRKHSQENKVELIIFKKRVEDNLNNN